MSRYIKADEVLKTIKKMLYETALNNFTTDRKFADDCEEIAEHRLATWIGLVPTADVVEVVRCRDCTWWKSIFSWNGKEHKVCVRESAEPSRESDDYCSYGERREYEIQGKK